MQPCPEQAVLLIHTHTPIFLASAPAPNISGRPGRHNAPPINPLWPPKQPRHGLLDSMCSRARPTISSRPGGPCRDRPKRGKRGRSYTLPPPTFQIGRIAPDRELPAATVSEQGSRFGLFSLAKWRLQRLSRRAVPAVGVHTLRRRPAAMLGGKLLPSD